MSYFVLSIRVPITILVTALLTGCVIPFDAPEAFYEDRVENTLALGTSKQKVVETIGEPDLKRDTGSIWLYGRQRLLAEIAIPFGYYAAGGILEIPFKDYQVVVISFKDQGISAIEVIDEKNGCSDSGICVDWIKGGDIPSDEDGWLDTGFTYLDPNLTTVSSIGQDDIEAKMFTSHPNLCAIYLYLEQRAFQEAHIGSIIVSNSDPIWLNNSTYIFMTVDPGTHTVKMLQGGFWYSLQEQNADIDVECDGGDHIFLQAIPDKWLFSIEYIFEQIGRAQGMKEISDRNLIVLP